jgi:hypothetical protein
MLLGFMEHEAKKIGRTKPMQKGADRRYLWKLQNVTV